MTECPSTYVGTHEAVGRCNTLLGHHNKLRTDFCDSSLAREECITIRLSSHALAILPLIQGELSFQLRLKVSSNRQDIMVLYPIIESESPSEIPAPPSDSVSHSLPELQSTQRQASMARASALLVIAL